MMLTHLIKKPLITEKSTQLAQTGKYAFLVALSANKHEIKKAVETAFGVVVTNVHTAIQPGGIKRVGKYRRELKITPTKKAIVQLKAGEKIDLFETKEP
ncbi:MAG: 50S ribosomal protein L23 [Candidatus Chisholmbacteria bacterium]|nr:50S ribosomal protein L23 [Candidatus Chisholmbacteria bacterium]